MLLAVLGITLAGSFTQNASRALFLLPDQKPVAFAAVIQPTGDGLNSDGNRGGARRLLPGRRRGPLGGVGDPTPPPAAAGGSGVGVEQLQPEGAPETLQNASDGAGGGSGPERVSGYQPGTSPLVGGAASPVGASSTPVEITPAVPEPPAWALGLAGLTLLGALREVRRRFAQHRERNAVLTAVG